MDANRAQSIFDSPDNIKVLYQGNSVWIDRIDKDSAQVHFLDSKEQMLVPISMLVEKA